MPNSPRNANDEYQQGPRIPEARRLDLDKVADLDPKTNPFGLGHMLPTVETFRSAVGESVLRSCERPSPPSSSGEADSQASSA